MNYKTNICIHCNRPKEKHSPKYICFYGNDYVEACGMTTFKDSGEKKLEDAAESMVELLQEMYRCFNPNSTAKDSERKAINEKVEKLLKKINQ